MIEIDIKKLKSETFPKEVVKAYNKMSDAQIIFGVTCSQYAPKSPLDRGDNLLIDNKKYAVVQSVQYRPYSNFINTIGPWAVMVLPTNKDFTKQFIRKNAYPLNDKMDIKLIES